MSVELWVRDLLNGPHDHGQFLIFSQPPVHKLVSESLSKSIRPWTRSHCAHSLLGFWVEGYSAILLVGRIGRWGRVKRISQRLCTLFIFW